ncbi:DUF4238 domain-containing protein [Bacillus infantis]|uniref:DUF4238 domain-containing protein n=1 Tax=Bacillus infantis TaxID=324767 RepID=UPI003CEA36CE
MYDLLAFVDKIFLQLKQAKELELLLNTQEIGDMMKGKRKRKGNIKQHYVPQYYLRNFTDNKHLFVYDIQNNRSYNANVENIGSEKYFYDIDIDLAGVYLTVDMELTETYVDDQIRLQNENLCSPVIYDFQEVCNILKDIKPNDRIGILFSDDTWPTIIDFILVQFVRTKKIRKLFSELAETSMEELKKQDLPKQLQIKVNDKNFWMSYFHNIFLYGVLSLSNKTKGIHLTDSFEKVFNIFIEEIQEFKSELEKSTKILMYNTTETPFMTSDHPVCVYNKADELSEFEVVYLPITKDISLLFVNSKLEEFSYLNGNIQVIREDNISIVENYNLFVTQRASQRVYSYTNDFDQVKSFVKGKIKMKLMIPQTTKDFVGPDRIVIM